MGTTEKLLARAVQSITGANYTTAQAAVRQAAATDAKVGKALHLAGDNDNDTANAPAGLDPFGQYLRAVGVEGDDHPLQANPWADIVFTCTDCATVHIPAYDHTIAYIDRYAPTTSHGHMCDWCEALPSTVVLNDDGTRYGSDQAYSLAESLTVDDADELLADDSFVARAPNHYIEAARIAAARG